MDGGGEREEIVAVFEEDDGLLFDFAGEVEAGEDVGDFGLGWVVEDAALDLGAEDAVDHVVEAGGGDLVVGDGLLEGVTEVG